MSKIKGAIVVDTGRCKGCSLCVDVGCIESGSTSCPKASECRTIGMWMKLGEIVNDYLDSITLADLLAQ